VAANVVDSNCSIAIGRWPFAICYWLFVIALVICYSPFDPLLVGPSTASRQQRPVTLAVTLKL
jgi:hypothetical protein